MGELPNALDRREYLYGQPKRKPKFESLGDDYAAAGNYSDAFECYERLDPERRDSKLKAMSHEALKDGNYFLLNRIDAHLPLKPDDWLDAARKAKDSGKLLYAYKSAQRGEDPALIDELREALGIAKPAAAEEAFVDYLVSGEGQVLPEGGDEPPAGDPEGEEAVG